MYFYIWILLAWLIGTPISSYFRLHRGEKFTFNRTYRLYKSGRIDLMTLIAGSIINIILGSIVLCIIGAFVLDNMWQEQLDQLNWSDQFE